MMIRTTLADARSKMLAPIDRRFGTHRGLVRLMLSHLEAGTGRLRPFAVPNLAQTRRVVFVCQGNICRSCFAEQVARRLGMVTASFGLATAGNAPADPLAIATARRHDIDLTAHRTTDIEDFEFIDGDLLLLMEIRHARRLAKMTFKKKVSIGLLGAWATPPRPHIHDPHTLSPEYFATCYQVIVSAVEGIAAKLAEARAPAAGDGPGTRRLAPHAS